MSISFILSKVGRKAQIVSKMLGAVILLCLVSTAFAVPAYINITVRDFRPCDDKYNAAQDKCA